MQNKIKLIYWLIAILALIGLADSTYLTAEKLFGGSPVCVISKTCDQVLNSIYASIGPIPISALGIGYYLSIFLLTLSLLQKDNLSFRKLLTLIVVLGFIASLGFVYLQAFVIHAYCTWCLISAGITIFILILLIIKYSYFRKSC